MNGGAAQLGLGVVIALVLIALAFDFMNGFHDAANSIATVVSTRVLKPYQAVMLAAFFNFVAVFVFHLSVASTVGKGIIDQGIVDHYVVFGALIGAIAWNLITWWYGIPSSSSHALIGGIVGAGVAKAGTWALIPAGILKTVAFIFISPLIGMVLGGLLLLAISWIFRRTTPSRVDRLFRRLQLISSSMYSLGHGGNDAQKTIGIIWMLLIAAGYTGAKDAVPFGHDVRRLAHRQDHGPAHHQDPAGRRLLRRALGLGGALPRYVAGHSGVDHAHHHRLDRRRRRGAVRVRRPLGRGRGPALGVDPDHPVLGLHRRDRVGNRPPRPGALVRTVAARA